MEDTNQIVMSMERVNAIPTSKWAGRKRKGDSMYADAFNMLMDMPVSTPMEVKAPGLKASQLYNGLWLRLKRKKVKNIRLAIRKGGLFAEKLFES